ncbi:NEL-type E3 ubiquitin ligase domain-containing protein [Pseudomonas asiatica]|uniref:NEL-type E3 ubiquitin ligase domain-containing protein n=1 Tax=Pseudomonas asiatica TaxID=2219225 RepID=UPI0024B5F1C3|nr:NEL-type E3 ubiquitin ligase domain-containing protein [Pseudomonas asiatica]
MPAAGQRRYAHEPIDEETRANWVASETSCCVLNARQPGTAGSKSLVRKHVPVPGRLRPGQTSRPIRGIIDAALAYPRSLRKQQALRERLFREADGPRTCDDRLLLMLNQMEVGVMAYQGVEGCQLR